MKYKPGDEKIAHDDSDALNDLAFYLYKRIGLNLMHGHAVALGLWLEWKKEQAERGD